MIKIAPHSTLSPQMWCIKKMKGLHAPRVIGKNLQTCRTQKIRLSLKQGTGNGERGMGMGNGERGIFKMRNL